MFYACNESNRLIGELLSCYLCRLHNATSVLLPRDAMHECGLCRRAVSVCPSVRLDVCHVRIFCRNKQMYPQIICSPSDRSTIQVCPHQTLWQYSDWDPLIAAKSRFSTKIWLWHWSLLDRRMSSTFRRWWSIIGYSNYVLSVSCDKQMPPRHAPVNLVYDRKPRRYAEDNITEFNCTHW